MMKQNMNWNDLYIAGYIKTYRLDRYSASWSPKQRVAGKRYRPQTCLWRWRKRGGQGSTRLDQLDENMSGIVLPIGIIRPPLCTLCRYLLWSLKQKIRLRWDVNLLLCEMINWIKWQKKWLSPVPWLKRQFWHLAPATVISPSAAD